MKLTNMQILALILFSIVVAITTFFRIPQYLIERAKYEKQTSKQIQTKDNK